jgi:hypothetical protein
VSTADPDFPTRLRITYTYSTFDELPLTDKYLLSTYNQTNQNSEWSHNTNSWPSVSNPILAFDECFQTRFNLTVVPSGSCSSLPPNGYYIEDDHNSSTINEITSNILRIDDVNSYTANPNEDNSVGTPGNLLNRLNTGNIDIISKPTAVLSATRVDLPSQQIKGTSKSTV